MTEPNWGEISEKLRAPFDPADVDFRPQGNPKPNDNCQVVCYVDARAVMDRLDDVVGAGNWSFTYKPLVTANGQVMIAKGRLALYGVVKEDVGEASNFDASKGCVSDALKRAAVQWGIGRYLYAVPSAWVMMDAHKQIPAGVLTNLRRGLPGGSGRVVDIPVEREQVVTQPVRKAPTPIRRPEPNGEMGATPATLQQLHAISDLCAVLGKPEPKGDLTAEAAGEMIAKLNAVRRAQTTGRQA